MRHTEKQSPFQLATKAIMYLPLCEQNAVAAAIVDYLYCFCEFSTRVRRDQDEPFEVYVPSALGNLVNPSGFSKYGYSVNVDGDPEPTLQELRQSILPLFVQPCELSDSVMQHALKLLLEKNYIGITFYDDETIEQFDANTPILFHLWTDEIFMEQIDKALVKWYSGKTVASPPLLLFDRAKERKVVRAQCDRAARDGQAAHLTLEEWMETLEYFQGRCAFDASHRYEVLEHVVPIGAGGGSTTFNVVPACYRCNAAKRDRHPSNVTDPTIQQAMPQICAYLTTRREAWLAITDANEKTRREKKRNKR